MKKTSIFSLAIIIVLLALGFSSCGYSESRKGYDIESYSGNIGDAALYKSELSYTVNSSDEVEQKLVVNSTVRCESKQFDESLEAIKKSVSELDGYIKSSKYYDNSSRFNKRTVSLVARIPSEKYQSFDDAVSSAASVTYRDSSISDITESYYSVKSKYESLLIQEERLLAMLEKADTLADMLVIEDKLAEVRGNIQNYETTLRTYDNKVSYATVEVTLAEVETYTETSPSFGERIKTAFSDSWADFADGAKDFAVWFVETFPTLIILAVIVLIIILIVKGCIKSSKKKQEKRHIEIVKAYAEKQAQNGSVENKQN